MKSEKPISCRERVLELVQQILGNERFPVSDIIIAGISDMINHIADYHEEGVKLFPEVILLNDKEKLRPIQSRSIVLYNGIIGTKQNQFSLAMKLCAPLAVNNWHIFIVIPNDKEIIYGVISAEITETSLSLDRQVIEMAGDEDNVIYIRNIGGKNVELKTKTHTYVVSLSLDDEIGNQDENLSGLVDSILSDCQSSDKLRDFLKKTLKDALNAGHGNLIAVCKEEKLHDCLEKMSDGVIINPTIDIPKLFKDDLDEQTNIKSVALKSHMALVKSMINHDGITIFSTTGKLLGFHYIVNNSEADKNDAVGGSRTKAFGALTKLECLESVYFKSQDGVTKFNKNVKR